MHVRTKVGIANKTKIKRLTSLRSRMSRRKLMTCWDTNMNCGVGQNTGIRGTRAQPEHVNRDTRELLPVPSGQSSEQDSDHTRTQANRTQREHLVQGGVTEEGNVDTHKSASISQHVDLDWPVQRIDRINSRRCPGGSFPKTFMT